MRKIVVALSVLFLLFLIQCGSYLKYPDEIKLAYEFVHPLSQETIRNWKRAKVANYTPTHDLEIINAEHKLTNIKDIETLQITFKTIDYGNLGPIVVYIDKNSKQILGSNVRK